MCDVANHALIDVLATRDFTAVARWLRRQPHHVRENLEYGCLDMSKTYNAVFKVVTPKATRVIDRFHVMRHAILAVDQVRRRVQQQRLGHRGRAGDPLYKARKLLVIKATANDPELSRLEGLLALGDPDGEVAFAYSVKEAVASFYETDDPEAAADLLRDIIDVASKRSAPPEVRTPGPDLAQLVRVHRRLAPRPTGSNGPTEGMNNLLKRVKRVAFGFTNFENFRIRALLYAGKPNFRVLDSIVVA